MNEERPKTPSQRKAARIKAAARRGFLDILREHKNDPLPKGFQTWLDNVKRITQEDLDTRVD